MHQLCQFKATQITLTPCGSTYTAWLPFPAEPGGGTEKSVRQSRVWSRAEADVKCWLWLGGAAPPRLALMEDSMQ